jgi:hypothetical protein
MHIPVLNLTLRVTHALWLPLAQSARSTRASNHVWFYLAALVGCIVVLVGLGYFVWRCITRPIESHGGEAAFNLSDLRRMHRQGELSDDEYLAARAVALAASGVDLGEPAQDVHPTASAPRQPLNRSGVELGPELLDPPEKPPDASAESDNPNQAPPTDDTEHKD